MQKYISVKGFCIRQAIGLMFLSTLIIPLCLSQLLELKFGITPVIIGATIFVVFLLAVYIDYRFAKEIWVINFDAQFRIENEDFQELAKIMSYIPIIGIWLYFNTPSLFKNTEKYNESTKHKEEFDRIAFKLVHADPNNLLETAELTSYLLGLEPRELAKTTDFLRLAHERFTKWSIELITLAGQSCVMKTEGWNLGNCCGGETLLHTTDIPGVLHTPVPVDELVARRNKAMEILRLATFFDRIIKELDAGNGLAKDLVPAITRIANEMEAVPA